MHTILVMQKFKGIGDGFIQARSTVHCHFEPFKSVNDFTIGSTLDNILYRHLAIYLLDKLFRLSGKYTNRHIPLPIALVYGKDDENCDMPIGLITEKVYGSETSSYCSEHLDWDIVASCFAQYGFTKLDDDYVSGFADEGGVDHNHFKQDVFFPEERKKTYTRPDSMPWLVDRYATSRWMRIDFGLGSFRFEANLFTDNFSSKEILIKKTLSYDEYYFLTQYALIVVEKAKNKLDIENTSRLHQCVNKIIEDNLDEVYWDQLELLKRQIVDLQLHHEKQDCLFHESDDSSKFQTYLKAFKHKLILYANATLESLREIKTFYHYISGSSEIDEYIFERVEFVRVEKKGLKKEYPLFFSPRKHKNDDSFPDANKNDNETPLFVKDNAVEDLQSQFISVLKLDSDGETSKEQQQKRFG